METTIALPKERRCLTRRITAGGERKKNLSEQGEGKQGPGTTGETKKSNEVGIIRRGLRNVISIGEGRQRTDQRMYGGPGRKRMVLGGRLCDGPKRGGGAVA